MEANDRPLTEAELACVMRDALRGLAHLHTHRMIHRDIKAGNLLLTGTGDVKLADFGVSKQLSDANSKRKTVIGSPFWMGTCSMSRCRRASMCYVPPPPTCPTIACPSLHPTSPSSPAPEVVQEVGYDFKADIWSLGTRCYVMS